MGKKCVVPGCKSGYKYSWEKVSLFAIPKRKLKEWQPLIRTDRELTERDNICEKHFKEKHIVRAIHCELYSYCIRYPRLSPDAVPSRLPRRLLRKTFERVKRDTIIRRREKTKSKKGRNPKTEDASTSANPLLEDSEKLIEEVSKHPVLYDQRLKGKSQTDTITARKSHWEDVTKTVFEDVWDGANDIEKEALVREIQVKWKYLRDQYTRTRKLENQDEQKGVVKSRRRFPLYDKLTFIDSGGSDINSSPNAIFLLDHVEAEDSNNSLDDHTYLNSEESIIIKGDQEMYEANASSAGMDHSSVDTLDGQGDRLTSILAEIVKMQKDDRTDDRLGNKKFLLSLLPFLEKLPDDVNLEVRLQLMSILQTYANGESFLRT